MFNKKGFIGAIGDDLPSLIPIIVALLLFFTVFSITFNSYNEKNALLRKNISLMNISRDLKGDSLILGVDQFLGNCNRIKFNQYGENFMVAIYSNDTLTGMFSSGENFLDDFKNPNAVDYPEDIENFLKGLDEDGLEKTYFCYYKKIGGMQISDKRANYLTRFYPVAIQEKVSIGETDYLVVSPGIMIMVIW
ncbi:MAG: hypothetical protein PHP82_04050 [Candidatus ainarchaeum sp.]|nr:hypothetical protein [Candidatus ainarchaeum sp.]